MRSRTLVGAALLLLGSALGPLAGCSSDDGSDATSPTTDAASTSPAPPTSPTTTATAPTGTPSPTVEPASGPSVVVTDLGDPVLRLRVPAEGDWEARLQNTVASTFLPDGGLAEVSGQTVKVLPGKGLDYYLRLTQSTVAPLELKLERLENRVVDGVEGYVAQGTNAAGFFYYFGAIYGDVQADVIFRLPQDDATSRALIESVLASAEWV